MGAAIFLPVVFFILLIAFIVMFFGVASSNGVRSNDSFKILL